MLRKCYILGWNESFKFHDLCRVLFALVHVKAVVSFPVAHIKMFQLLLLRHSVGCLLPAWRHMALSVCVGTGLMVYLIFSPHRKILFYQSIH